MDYYMKKRHSKIKNRFEVDYALVEFCLDKGATSTESVNLTLEKAISHQLFYKGTEVDLDMNESDVDMSSADTSEYCYITSPGQKSP